MSARHRRKIRERADTERQVDMLERFYRHGARFLFTLYLRETHLPRMIALRGPTPGEKP